MGLLVPTPRYNPTTDIPDLTGKVALVTGGNAGIGYHTVAELVRHGAKVYMGARNESRATGAIARLKAEGALDAPGSGQVVWLNLDLSTPASTTVGAHEFLSRETRLDILVNNAALLADPNSFSPVEPSKVPMSAMMSTNHLGPFVLTTALLPLLKKTAAEPGSDVRVITVGSSAHAFAKKIDWKTTDQWSFRTSGFFRDFGAYGTSKLANMLFAKELQRRLDAEAANVLSICLDPGAAKTENSLKATKTSWIGSVLQACVIFLFGIPPAQGAYTSLFAATSPIIQANKSKYAGTYLTPVGVITEPSKVADDPLAARDLWETSERVVSEM